MLCTIIRQIAVEINSNYGPGFKSIIFLFVLKYPWVQLWSLALFTCIVSLRAAGEERAPTHLCVLHLCSLNNTKCVCMDIFKCYLIHRGCINTKCKIPVRKSRVWCCSCSTSPTRTAYVWVPSIPHTLQSPALTWSLASPFISVRCWIFSAYVTFHLIVWWFRNKYGLDGINNNIMPNIPEFVLIKYLHWKNKCGEE